MKKVNYLPYWTSHYRGDLPIIISFASLALADAGIMMYDLVASVSVVWRYAVSTQCYLHWNNKSLDFFKKEKENNNKSLNLTIIEFWLPVLFREEHHHWSNLRRGSLARGKPYGILYAILQGDHTTDAHRGVDWRKNHQYTPYALTNILWISSMRH
jgi:hypothetical protein